MAGPRILLVSYTVPENKMGGGLILYRHFILKKDFEVGVVTNNPVVVPGIFYRQVEEPRWLRRLKNTRFSLWFEDYTHLVYAKAFDRRLEAAVREFKPDIIFNVAETYLSFHAQKLARKLGIPFVAYFMDWATYAARCHPWAVPHLDRMYRNLYQQADLALCICDGMKRELGQHPNAHVLYPMGVDMKSTGHNLEQSRNTKFTYCFAGNLGQWYGRMIYELIRTCDGNQQVGLKVFGAYHSWPENFVTDQTAKGVFRGFRPFDELVTEYQNSDAFLLPMGFGPESALIERTSFKTKLLDYIAFDRPVLVWGPEDCTAVQIARKFGLACCVTDPNPQAALAGMMELAGNATLRNRLVANAAIARQTELNHESVYSILRNQVDKLLNSREPRQPGQGSAVCGSLAATE